MEIKKFASIFDGLKEAYCYFKIEKTGSNGKAQGKAGVTRLPLAMAMAEKDTPCCTVVFLTPNYLGKPCEDTRQC